MMKVYLKALVPLVVFAAMQGLAGVALWGLRQMPVSLSIAVLLSGLLTVFLLWRIGMIRFDFSRTTPLSGKDMAGCLIAAFSCIVATDLLSEFLSLPDLMEGQFLSMAHTVWGAVTIALVGPVVEEFVFREAMLGSMLRGGVGRWTAVLFSAFLFGLVHGNPVQIPFAFIVGIIFGLIYCRTGNVALTSAIHIANNSIAVIEMNLLGDSAADFYFYNLMGRPVAVAVIVASAAVCIFFTKKTLLPATVCASEEGNDTSVATDSVDVSNNTVG